MSNVENLQLEFEKLVRDNINRDGIENLLTFLAESNFNPLIFPDGRIAISQSISFLIQSAIKYACGFGSIKSLTSGGGADLT